MEKTKFTAGPWYPVEYAGYWQLHTAPFYGEPDLLNTEDVEDMDISEANATLAACSPLLYNACYNALAELKRLEKYTDQALISELKSTLSKAGGE